MNRLPFTSLLTASDLLATLGILAALTGCVNTEADPAPTPKAPVYDFGDGYALIQNDSVPRLQGDSLYAHLGFDCTPAGTIALEYFKTGDASYEVWIHAKRPIVGACAIPIVDERALKVPDALKNAASVKLVTSLPGISGLTRIELKD